jgi:hypothetical protein
MRNTAYRYLDAICGLFYHGHVFFLRSVDRPFHKELHWLVTTDKFTLTFVEHLYNVPANLALKHL